MSMMIDISVCCALSGKTLTLQSEFGVGLLGGKGYRYVFQIKLPTEDMFLKQLRGLSHKCHCELFVNMN